METDLTEERARPRRAAVTVAATGIGRLRVRPVRSVRAAAVRTPVRAPMATTGVDHPRPLPGRSWICGSRSCVRLRAATEDTRVPLAPRMAAATAGTHARPAQRMAVPVARPRATVDIAAPRATGEAADTTQRRVAVAAITPVAEAADALTEVAAEVAVTTAAAEVVDTQAVVVAAIPVAEDIAEVIAKSLETLRL